MCLINYESSMWNRFTQFLLIIDFFDDLFMVGSEGSMLCVVCTTLSPFKPEKSFRRYCFFSSLLINSVKKGLVACAENANKRKKEKFSPQIIFMLNRS